MLKAQEVKTNKQTNKKNRWGERKKDKVRFVCAQSRTRLKQLSSSSSSRGGGGNMSLNLGKWGIQGEGTNMEGFREAVYYENTMGSGSW